MTTWRELAPSLDLVHSPDPSSPMSQGIMEGALEGHQVWVRQIDEYRRTSRTGITLTFEAPLGMRLSISASASSRGQAHWLWLGLVGVFFAGGIGGAIAAKHPGPLVVCLGGALVLWGWLVARRSAARREAKRVPLGDPDLDRLLHVEAEDPDLVLSLLRDSETRELLLALAVGDRELSLTDRKIALDINRLVKTRAEFEEELGRMAKLANLLAATRADVGDESSLPAARAESEPTGGSIG